MSRSSSKQEDVYQFITEYIAAHSYAPSIREIGEAVGLSSTATVYYHLNALQQEGRIRMDKSRKRSITLPDAVIGHVPIVGVVTAGRPILAVEHIEGYLPIDGETHGRFALRVRGDSMVGAGIFEGDLVVVRQQQDAISGRIVVALLGDEATVKRFHRDETGVWLLPENPAYEPIDAREANILGRVVALVRNYQ
ncbi:MAG: transcriptional repressor LexA [Oscillospiraceae bacterium]|nr:transcriptional repressor LexA [Oscillospiraceae bacterium]